MDKKQSTTMKVQKRSFLSILTLFAFFIAFYACTSTNPVEEKIAKIPVDIKFDRFDVKFFNASPTDFYSLKKEYPYLFPAQFPDSIWLNRQRDSLQVLLQKWQQLFIAALFNCCFKANPNTHFRSPLSFADNADRA